MSCEYCDDGEGGCIYPYYGVAPHIHEMKLGYIGSTRFLPKTEWPENFQPDEESLDTNTGIYSAGIYTYCLECGSGDNSTIELQSEESKNQGPDFMLGKALEAIDKSIPYGGEGGI